MALSKVEWKANFWLKLKYWFWQNWLGLVSFNYETSRLELHLWKIGPIWIEAERPLDNSSKPPSRVEGGVRVQTDQLWPQWLDQHLPYDHSTMGNRIPAVFYHPWRLIYYNEPWQPKRKLSSKLSSTANWQVDQDPSVSGAPRREVQVQDFHFSIYFVEIKIKHSFTQKKHIFPWNQNILYIFETLYILGTGFSSTRERRPMWKIQRLLNSRMWRFLLLVPGGRHSQDLSRTSKSVWKGTRSCLSELNDHSILVLMGEAASFLVPS